MLENQQEPSFPTKKLSLTRKNTQTFGIRVFERLCRVLAVEKRRAQVSSSFHGQQQRQTNVFGFDVLSAPNVRLNDSPVGAYRHDEALRAARSKKDARYRQKANNRSILNYENVNASLGSLRPNFRDVSACCENCQPLCSDLRYEEKEEV